MRQLRSSLDVRHALPELFDPGFRFLVCRTRTI